MCGEMAGHSVGAMITHIRPIGTLIGGAVSALLLIMASDAAATTGDLTQKPGVAGCWSAVGLCSPGTGLAGARSVTVSPDGRSAYVASQAGSAVSVFDRAVDGTLTQKPGTAGCISETGTGPCVDGTALDSARSVTVSPDGRSAYVASGSIGAVAVFDRAPDGTLTQKAGAAACVSDTGAAPCVDATALGDAFEVTVSPDGRNAYVASYSSGAVAVFDRAADGTLTQKAGTAACISDTGAGPCADGTGLGGALGVVVSPDGASAYVASFDSGAVAVFDRAADGTLTHKAGTAACISDSGAGPCVDGTALAGAASVTVSRDGRSIYVASQLSSAVAVLDRAADGTLTQKAGTAACISDTGAGPCADGTALAVATSVAVSPDGQSAYVASFDSDAVAVLDRAADGTLTQKPGTTGCISEIVLGTCDVGSALDGPRWVTVSPDGRSAYAASVISGAVTVFDREPPPVPGLSVEDLTTDEPAPGSSSRRIVRVYLSAPSQVDVSVDYVTADRSATAPGDYTAIAGTLTIPAGRTGGPILVRINGDTIAEGDEQFTVTLSNPRNATIARAAATVTIQDAVAPDTLITAGPASGSTVNDPPRFEFRAITPNPWHFECEALWEGAASTGFRRCASPHVVTPPTTSARGRLLRFQVRAVDFDGIPDPTPDTRGLITYQPPLSDVSLVGIEVTQGVQERDCRSSRCEAGIMTPDYVERALGRNPAARYEGVVLSEARQTVVRVYVQARGDRAFASGVTVRLEGWDSNGRSLVSGGGGGILLPRYLPAVAPPCCNRLTFADRGNLQYAYTFPLPPEWSRHRTIGVRAVVSPRVGVTDSRPGDNWLEVTDIPFQRPTTIRLRPVAMSIGGTWPGASDSAFVGARATFPTAFEIPPYQGVVDATAVARAAGRERQASMALTLLDDWADDMNYRSGVYPFGLFQPGLGLNTGATMPGTALYRDRTVSFARWGVRALTSSAHELGHGLGLPHAGLKCGSNDGGQIGSAWPPDDEGRTQGFGLDTRGGMYRIWPDTDAQPSWDLMSYCPVGGATNDDLHWLSPRNWNHLIDYFAPRFALPARAGGPTTRASATAAAAARQGATRALAVTASVDASGAVSILSVRRITAVPTPSLSASPWRIVVRNAAGRALSDAGVAPIAVHDSDAQIFKAKAPATGAASVQVVKDGAVVAERRRSAHAPRARILSPRRGARVRGRATTVRWRASDSDRDQLTVSLDYSGDGGRRWRTIFIGPDRGRAVLPTRLLTGSRNARLRLRANDGFSETATISGRFVSAGAPPTVSIVTPSKASAIRADATLVAAGSAYDDGNRRLTGRRLTWRLGRRVIGRGAEISATDLPAGRHRLRLSARDRRGRIGTSSVSLRVLLVTPQFIELSAPPAITRTARRVRVRVLTNVTATLRIGGQRFRVSRRPRTISVRVTPGRRPLQLRATLAAAGRRNAATLVVARRI